MNELSWIYNALAHGVSWLADLVISSFPAALLSIRAVAHFLIFLRVVSFFSEEGSSHRKAVGIAAAAFAGFNLAECIRVISNFNTYLPNVEPYLPGIMVMVLVFVIWSGGNLAKFLPRKILERLP